MTIFDGLVRRRSGRLAPAPARVAPRDRKGFITRGASRAAAEELERRVLLSTTLAAPTRLAITGELFQSVSLAWYRVVGASRYEVEEAPGGSGRFSAVEDTVDPAVPQLSIVPATPTDFRVRAIANDGSLSPPSAILTVTVPLEPPFVNAVSVSTSQIDLSWDLDVDPPSSVEIDRSTDGVHFAKVAVVPPGTLHFSDTGLTEGTEYSYKLRAIHGSFVSAFSDVAGGSLFPTAPVGLTARAVSTNQIDLAWRNVSRHATGVTVYRSDDGGMTFQAIESVDSRSNTFVDPQPDEQAQDPQANHTYQYYVAADTNGAISPPSNTVRVTTPPAGVTNLGATPVSASEIDLSWDRAVSGTTGIEVDVSTDDRSFRPVSQSPLPATARVFRSTGLSSDTHYFYQVRALRPGGPSAFTATDAYTEAATPTNLRATLRGLKEIDLTWTSHSRPGTTFEILREPPGTDGQVTRTQFSGFEGIGTTTGTSFVDTFDSPGDSEEYVVIAENFVGDLSPPSNAVVATEVLPWPGFPDTAFGDSGVTGERFQGDSAQAVALAPDGKIVVASGDSPGVVAGLPIIALELTRLNPDGSLDHSFGTQGHVRTDLPALIDPNSLLVQPDGKIVVTDGDDLGNQLVLRYISSGAPDPTFGTAGVVILSSAMGGLTGALAPDGQIIVTSNVEKGSHSILALTSLTPTGRPNPRFGTAGTSLLDLGSDFFGAQFVRLAPDGGIVVGAGNLIARFTSTGAPDASFGTGGVVHGLSSALDAAVQPDGKVLVREADAVQRLLRNGAPDPSFGRGGTAAAAGDGSLLLRPDGTMIVMGNFGFLEALTASGAPDPIFGSAASEQIPTGVGEFSFDPTAFALQHDGKIVVVGGGGGIGGTVGDFPFGDFATLRLLPNGNLDSSFGYFGLSLMPDGLTGGISAIGIQGGKIVAGGTELNPDPNLPDEADLVRYNPDGSLDTTFGRNGHAYLRIGHQAVFDTMAIEPNGDIVVGGSGEVRGAQVFVVARYLSGGFIDPSFGTNGVVMTTFGSAGTQECKSLAVQPNGDIVAVGSTDRQIVAARFLPSGALDPRFGTGGKLVLAPGGAFAQAAGMALQSDGRIVIGATLGSNFGVIRLTSTGALDPTFGTGGVVRTVIAGGSTAAALTLDHQGRIVLGGSSGASLASPNLFTVARYLPNGRLDPTFGAGGIMRWVDPNISAALGATVTALAIDSHGQIVAGGSGLAADVFRLTDRGPDPDFGAGGEHLLDGPGVTINALAVDTSGMILVGALGLWRLFD